jgi:hypothetical protein
MAGLAFSGCSSVPKGTQLPGPYPRITTIAVAPAMNASGSTDFDRIQLADIMADELSHFDGVRVIGANKVLAVLATEDEVQIRSASHALRVSEKLGADGILVFAITSYDPYSPPTVGLSAELFGWSGDRLGRFDPVSASRQATPSAVPTGPDDPLVSRSQVQRVFNGSHEDVQQLVRHFGELRDGDRSPYGWRRYLVSQEDYMRFCCHATLREMMGLEYHRVLAGRDMDDRSEGTP